MDSIQSALVKYNANSRNNRVGDCVKRSLAVAYSMDYDAVSAELNRIKRQIGAEEYNNTRVFNLFMKNRGDAFQKVPKSDYITVEDFADSHSSGIWLLLAGKNINDPWSTHMIALVNGDIYDSWNSLEYYVKEFTNVSTGKSDVYELDWSNIAAQVTLSVYDYVVHTLSKKQPDCMYIACDHHAMTGGNKYTYKIYMSCKLGEVPRSSKYWSNQKYGHYIVIKLNPRMSEEENIASLTKKCKQKAYDWIYNIKDDIVQSQKAESMETGADFHGDRKLLLKCPEEARPYITWAYDRGSVMDQYSYNYWPRYEVSMDPMPGDPRIGQRYGGGAVHFQADTLRELRDQFERYLENYDRPEYDY